MRTRETFYRSEEVLRETRRLPAACYNLTRILLSRNRQEAVFVPIRSMLYLAVIDAEEVIFLDGAVSRSRIVLAWQNFRPGARRCLDDPVAYDVVYYQEGAPGIMQRLVGEFQKALRLMDAKQPRGASGQILTLRK